MLKIDSYEQRFHQIVNNILDIIVEIDLNGNFTYVSPQVYGILGYYPDEVIGVSGLKFVHPEDLPKVIEEMGDLLKPKKNNSVKILSTKYRVLHKKGHYIFLSARGSLVEIEGNMKFIAVLSDITEQLKYEQKLKESEDRYRLINENANDLIAVIDNNLQIIFGNNAYLSLGYSMDEISKLRPVEFIHPNDFDQAIKVFKKCLKTGTGLTEIRFKHKDGHFNWFEVKGKSFRDENRDLRILLISRDITERKKAEQKVKESEEKYRVLFENSPYGIGLVDMTGKILDVNHWHENSGGFTKSDFIGKSFGKLSLIPKKFIPIIAKGFKDLLKNGTSKPVEVQLYNKDGSLIWVYLQATLIKLGDKKLIQVITQNITAIKESEEKFKTIAEQSFVGFLIVQNNRIVYSNNTIANIFGFSFEELNQMSIIDAFKFIHPEDLSIAVNRFKKREEEEFGEISSEPLRIITRSGEIKWIDVYTKMLQFQEKNTIFATIVDVTKERKADMELQKLNELKSEFLRRASHELKTPLISIKGFTNLILKQYGGTIDNEITSMLEEVDRGCHRLEDIIKNLIQATKIESSKLELETTVEDLSFLIRFGINELRGLTKSRNHTININIDEKIITKFNKEQMYEVLTNLLSNAIKYTPPNGEITIKSEFKDHNVILSIQDNGIGFTDKEKEKVFKQFGKIERYGQGLDIGIDGSGLGLYLSKKIVELHGGKIWMKSEGKNKGSIFYVLLPLIKN